MRRDAAGNVVARIGVRAEREFADDSGAIHHPSTHVTHRAPIAVFAHLDTVFTDDTRLEPRRAGRVVACPGIGDNARGLAALVTIAGYLVEQRALRRPIDLVATVGEEGVGNLRGARQYLDDRTARDAAPPHAVIALDGPGDATIAHHGLGSVRLRVEIGGNGGHSWTDRDAPNPVHAAGLAIADIAALARRLPRSTSITVTRMGGGESITAVPQSSWFEIDIRAGHGPELTRIERSARGVIARASQGLHVDIRVIGLRPAGALDAGHPLVARAVAITEACGVTPIPAIASSDANAALARGIPAIAIGAGGSGGNTHSTSEWYDDTNGDRGVARAAALILAMANDDG